MENRTLMSAGALDTSFGNGGYTVAPPSGIYSTGDGGFDCVLPAAGSKTITVADADVNGVRSAVLSRLNADGSVDTTFGTHGVSTPELFDGSQPVYFSDSAAFVAPGGKIVVAGTGSEFQNGSFILLDRLFVERFNADGSFDTTFNALATKSFLFGKAGRNERDIVTAGVSQPDGKVVLTAVSSGGRNANQGILRLNADGSIDRTFGFNGSGARLLTAVGGSDRSIALDAQGRILIGGATTQPYGTSGPTGGQLWVKRLTANGAVDTSFGQAGTAYTPALAGDAIDAGIAVQTNGTILVSGTDALNAFDINTASFQQVVAAFKSDGTPDSVFATNGILQYSVGYPVEVVDTQLQPDDKLVLLSQPRFNNVPQAYLLTRVTATGQVDTTFGTSGTSTQETPLVASTFTFEADATGGKFAVGLIDPTTGAITDLSVARLTDDVGVTTGQTKLTGAFIGTAGSYQNKGNTESKAFDGILTNYFDGPDASGDWVGLDLGSAKVATQVKFAPRVGFESRMVGGKIQASNTADFSSGVTTLLTINAAPKSGVFTVASLNNSAAYRYYRYIGANNSSCNIAELEFDG